MKKYNDNLNQRKAKKLQNLKFNDTLSNISEDIGMTEKTKELISDCGTFLAFVADLGLENKKLVNANFCKNRFCPHCSYNKSRKDALEFSILIKYLRDKYNFIFLTLTAPNVMGDDLEKELWNYSYAFQKLFKRKEIKQIVKGYIRKLEVTYNKKENTFHPHYHILIAVNKSYFTDKDYYIKRNRWLELWQKSKNDYSITQVDVRKFKKEDTGIFELAAYVGKDSDYLYSPEVFKYFYKALKGKQVITFKGVFAEAHKKYLNGQLDFLKEKDQTEYIYMLFYNWDKKNYVNTDYRFLDLEEYKKYNSGNFKEIELE